MLLKIKLTKMVDERNQNLNFGSVFNRLANDILKLISSLNRLKINIIDYEK